ncbi:MAG: family 16 glycosylhydrolase [Bacteroidota bacterium]
MYRFGIFIILFSLLACQGEEPTPITTFSASVSSLNEQDADQTYTVTITANTTATEDLSVQYELQEVSADFGIDVVEQSGTLVFQAGSDQATVDIVIKGDTDLEIEEKFDLAIFHNGTTLLPFAIVDNDTETQIFEDADGFYTPEQYPSMKRVWNEEFSGTTINADHWTHEVGDEWFNNELQSYSADPMYSFVSDGKLSIVARDNNGLYTSARMITKDKVEIRHGRIDIRARLPKGQGIWPALWMLGANIDDVSWPRCGEIDIMELVGHIPNETHGTAHYDNNGHRFQGKGKTLASGEFIDKFHVFSIIWDKDFITWYLDGEEFLTLNDASINGFPFTNEYFFILNVAVGGDWPGNPDATTVFPQTMEVDYIRVFQ